MGFSENIRKIREYRKLTQVQLADRIGVTPAAVNQYEKGIKLPNIIYAVKIADVLGTTCEELVNGKGDEQTDGK